jgi:blue copper oxidase
MKRIAVIFTVCVANLVHAQNPLFIPDTLNGTNFNLTVQNGTTQFFPPSNTPTYGINGAILSPTLFVNKWDWVTMNVNNTLTGNGNSTTMHWHGLHLPAMDDGGPHQIILQNTTWSPSFQILNNAGTYWYHPHGEGKTDLHVSKGLAGMIIIRDSAERALNLPRTYGVDDFPLIVQTKSFDILNQIAIATAYDTVPMVNATIDPYVTMPAQVVRLRLLDGASDRSFLFGFSNNMNFYQIATDGGLIDTALAMNRLRLSNGERAEVLVDLSGMQGDTVYLMSYGSELPNGIMGADSVGDAMNQVPDYYSNYLNGADFNLLMIIVGAPTANPVTTVPTALVPVPQISIASATVNRTIVFDTLSEQFTQPNLAEGPFAFDREFFDMDSINQVVYLNDTEIWTLINLTQVSHPFHIHDIQFQVVDINGGPVPANQQGWKDVVLVPAGDTVRFITTFTNFADDSVPYMYHCHLLHHEDDGMMASFVVIDTLTSIAEVPSINAIEVAVFPNPAGATATIALKSSQNSIITIQLVDGVGREVRTVFNGEMHSGENVYSLNTYDIANGIYFVVVSDGNRTYHSKISIIH